MTNKIVNWNPPTCVWTGVHKTYGDVHYMQYLVTRDYDANYKYKMMFSVEFLIRHIGCDDII